MTLPPRIVVDASVVAKWYLREPDRDKAAVLLREGFTRLAPDLVIPEFGNILWKRMQRGEMSEAEAQRIVSTFIATRPVTLRSSLPLLGPAVHLSGVLRHPVYDLIYLGLAIIENTQLVTADGRLLRLVRGTEVERSVVPLATLGSTPL